MRTLRLLLACLAAAAAATAGPPAEDSAVEARRSRRASLAERLGEDYALVLGRPLGDVLVVPQEGHFLYLTGVDDPMAVLLLAGAEARPLAVDRRADEAKPVREILYLWNPGDRIARFYGLRHRAGPQTERALGIDATLDYRQKKRIVKTLAAHLPQEAVLHVPGYRGRDTPDLRELRGLLLEPLRKARPDLRTKDLHPALAEMRSVKEPGEVAHLREAVRLTRRAFDAALPWIRPGSTEARVESALVSAVRVGGGRPGYPFVVASGVNATIPHYFRNEGPLSAGDLLVIDAGASVHRYSADITRTFPVSGAFDERQRELYLVVLAAQRAAIEAVKPGKTFVQVDRAARKVVSDAGLGEYFIHATSHHVGLDVHDPGPAIVKVGMTFTIEPGIYIPAERLGIRIEDIVHVTPEGTEVLTEDFPRTPDDVEAWLASAREPRPR